MLSVLQGAAFVSRVMWAGSADRIGGLQTVLAGSACQALAIAAFMTTQDEAGLFAIAAAYGLGFSGIVPGYVMAVRDLFPSREPRGECRAYCSSAWAAWRSGGWFAGALYDEFGFYGRLLCRASCST